MRRLLLLLASIAMGASASAKGPADFRAISPSESVQLRPDRAYLLLRVRKGDGISWWATSWLRVPTVEESARFEAARDAAYARQKARAGKLETFDFQDDAFNNVYLIGAGKPFESDPASRTFLVEAMPATYVLLGSGLTCFCLGTVQVEARPGIVTDLGTVLVARSSLPSAEPELASVTGLGPTASVDYPMSSAAIRPVSTSDRLPAALAALPRTSADYRAVGPFPVRQPEILNNLAPLPGVLEYRRGEVYDVKTGALLKPR